MRCEGAGLDGRASSPDNSEEPNDYRDYRQDDADPEQEIDRVDKSTGYGQRDGDDDDDCK
jgi:hypothetical protein